MMAGMVATALGLHFAFFSLPVWIASFVVAKSGLRGTNVTMNLFFLATNLISWAVVTYIALSLVAKQRRKHQHI